MVTEVADLKRTNCKLEINRSDTSAGDGRIALILRFLSDKSSGRIKGSPGKPTTHQPVVSLSIVIRYSRDNFAFHNADRLLFDQAIRTNLTSHFLPPNAFPAVRPASPASVFIANMAD